MVTDVAFDVCQERVALLPIVMVPGLHEKLEIDGFGVTEMEDRAAYPPSDVVTVIVEDPPATALTSPEELTVATLVSLDDQETFVFVAFEG